MSQPAVVQELHCPGCNAVISLGQAIKALSLKYLGNIEGTKSDLLAHGKTFFRDGGKYLHTPLQHRNCRSYVCRMYPDGGVELCFAGSFSR